MKHRLIPILTLALLTVLAGSSMAATWTQVGTPAYTIAQSFMEDYNRIIVNDIIVNNEGVIFTTANKGGWSGGITIFRPNGQVINVDLDSLNLRGSVTKLVLGGDGSVYGLQNWLEINWNYDRNQDNRILRIEPNGTVAVVHTMPTAGDFVTPTNRIQGLAVGDDGNLYYTRNPESNDGKVNFFYRINIMTDDSNQPAPINGNNNGWLDGNRFYELANAGNGWFVLLGSGSSDWFGSAMSWTDNRRAFQVNNWEPKPPNSRDPGHGRNHCIDLVRDKVRNVLWMAARGANNRLIVTRWEGTPGANSLFSLPTGSAADPLPGIQNGIHWHLDADNDLGPANRWVAALDTNPVTGDAWLSVIGEMNYNWSLRGRALRLDQFGGITDEGLPEANGKVVGITFASNGTCLILTHNGTTGGYKVWASGDIPGWGGCENDIDGDLVCDEQEDPNESVRPGRSNRILDDSDGDGLLDGTEDANKNGTLDSGETGTRTRDSDSDRFIDGLDPNPLSANAGYTDADNDELNDAQDPNSTKADTDNDRYKDGYEAAKLGAGAVNNAAQKPFIGDVNGDTFVTSLDALVIQSLFLQIINASNPVFDGTAVQDAFRFGDVNRDGFLTSLDALIVQSFFLQIAPLLPI